MAPLKKMSKVVTENEIESGRISLPATVRDDLFPHVSQNTKTSATMVDEKGDSYEVVLKVRHNRTKPEIMAKGGKKFAQKRKLKPDDELVFSRGQSGDHFKVRVKRRPSLTSFSASGSKPLASTVPAYDHASMETLVLGLGGPLATGSQTSVPTLGPYLIGSDDHATVALGLGSLSAQAKPPPVSLRLNLGLSIGSNDMPVEKTPATTVLELSLSNGVSNHAPPIKPKPAPPVKRGPTLAGFSASGSQPLALIGSDDHASSVNGPPSMETLVLGLGGPLDGSQTSVPTFGPFLIGSDDHATMPLGLGSLSVQAQPPPVNLRLSIGSDDMPVEKPPATTLLELSLSNHAPPIKPTPIPLVSSSVGRIKAEVEDVGPTLELTLGVGPPPTPTVSVSVSAKFVEAAEAKSKPPEGVWVAEQELQEPKPPTGLIHFSGLFQSIPQSNTKSRRSSSCCGCFGGAFCG